MTAEAQSSHILIPKPPQHPSLSPPILSDWRLVLSREAEAQTQTWSRTSVKSHVFITGFVPMMGLGGADWQPWYATGYLSFNDSNLNVHFDQTILL
ncbi:hypothetical protein JOQ06_009963 [Pogonophryne albipinna]|uniref:Uncharacterized protein n=1 Tax=Pogonophryne albipinna TaxID=1090488 RepID=A0AAD6BS45_9TELE|nr:hypothetical protein JOQ06_009963 [Pogonophryne albipinna]